MSDTVKLIIEIPKELYEMCKKYKSCTYDSETIAIANGTLLDDVKAEIEKHKEPVRIPYEKDYFSVLWAFDKAIEILDSIGKGTANETDN